MLSSISNNKSPNFQAMKLRGSWGMFDVKNIENSKGLGFLADKLAKKNKDLLVDNCRTKDGKNFFQLHTQQPNSDEFCKIAELKQDEVNISKNFARKLLKKFS